MEISKASAIVTGGSSGLGAAVVSALLKKGANVSILDLNPPNDMEVSEDINVDFFKVDICDDASIAEVFRGAARKGSPHRILVNCAGIGIPAKLVDKEGNPQNLNLMKRIIDVNLVGVLNVSSKFAARLANADLFGEEAGVIINVASVAAYDGQIGQASYSAAKGGIVSMTLPLARELAKFKIRVMSIAPGLFQTPLLDQLPDAALDSLKTQLTFPNRPGVPAEFAAMVCDIIKNPMLNGSTIRLDGALRMSSR